MRWKSVLALSCAAALANGSQAASHIPAGPIAKTPPFNVVVTLSPAASATLRAKHESIVVAAMFYGRANARGQKLQDDWGQINWAPPDRVEINGAGVAAFGPRDINTALLDFFVDRKPEVLINVVSGRRSGPNNLLYCSVFEDSIYLAGSMGIRIECKLISEGP
jgi:hypothetical protein